MPIITAFVAVEVENPKAKLKKAREETIGQKATAERATAELKTVKTLSEKPEARVAEVQQELKDAITMLGP